MFSFTKLKIFPPLIVITFLATLRSSHLLLNHLNLFRSLLNNFRSNHSTLSRFIPTQRCPTPPTIQCLKRSHTNARGGPGFDPDLLPYFLHFCKTNIFYFLCFF